MNVDESTLSYNYLKLGTAHATSAHAQLSPPFALLSMPARADDDAVLANILDESRVGRFTVPITNLEHTSLGRPLHTDGIKSIRDSITVQGWLGSKMTVCLVGSIPEGGLTEDAATGHQYRLINGNHRLAALRELQDENKAADPPVPTTDFIEVEVHAGLSLEEERLIASSKSCDRRVCCASVNAAV